MDKKTELRIKAAKYRVATGYGKMNLEERLKAAKTLNDSLEDLKEIDKNIVMAAYMQTRKGRGIHE